MFLDSFVTVLLPSVVPPSQPLACSPLLGSGEYCVNWSSQSAFRQVGEWSSGIGILPSPPSATDFSQTAFIVGKPDCHWSLCNPGWS